jgi:hypothetical protein
MFFNLSLHRSATTSTAQVFRKCNLSVCDWVGWEFEGKHQGLFHYGKERELTDAIMSTFPGRDYYGDLPIPLLHTELIKRYPEATYFMVLRDVDSWSESSLKHCIYTNNHEKNIAPQGITPANRMMLEYYGMLEEGTQVLLNSEESQQAYEIWRHLYHKHLISVFTTANANKIQLRLFYLSDPALGKKLVQLASPDIPLGIAEAYVMDKRHSTDRGRSDSDE